MKTTIQRCSHCGTTYSYCLSGNGCFEKTNDKYLCPEYKQVTIDALSKVKVKYCNGFKTIPFQLTDEMQKVKANILKQRENFIGNIHRYYGSSDTIATIEEYIVNGVQYIIRHYRDGRNEMCVLCEINCETHKFGDIWYVNKPNYYSITDLPKQPNFDNIKVQPMNKPLGRLIFNIPVIKEK